MAALVGLGTRPGRARVEAVAAMKVRRSRVIMVLKAVDSVPFRQVLRVMRPVRSIWLAGPEPWLPDAEAQAARQRALCLDNGFTGLTAPAIVETEADNVEVQARELYAERMAKLRQADAGIINLTPFRGPSCASAAAFEAGVLAG